MNNLKKIFINTTAITLLALQLVSCSGKSSNDSKQASTNASTQSTSFKQQNHSNTDIEHISAEQITITETEKAYKYYWLEDNNKGNGNSRTGEEILDQLDFLFDFVEQNNGKLDICVEFDFKSEKEVSADKLENIRETVENGVNQWKKGLDGYKGWQYNEDIPVRISAISKSKQTTLISDKNVFTGRETCLKEDAHFKVKFSDYNFGSRGRGGNWGMQLNWSIFNSELASGVFHITYHELGHVMGLPDIYTYPEELKSRHYLDNVSSIMANNGDKEIQDMDFSMLREVWEHKR